MKKIIWLALPTAIVLAGCSSSHTLQSPTIALNDRYQQNSAHPQLTEAEGQQQQLVVESVAARWWEAFGSPKLNRLIEQSLKQNPTLAAAEATLRQAEALANAKYNSTLYPRLDAVGSAQRLQLNNSRNGVEGGEKRFNLYNGSLSSSYNFDLSGANNRQLDALQAKANYQHYQLAGARLRLATEVAVTAIRQAQLGAQMEALERLIALGNEQLTINRERLRLGAIASHELLEVERMVAEQRAALPAMRHAYQQSRHALALLEGSTPDNATLPTFTLAEFQLPATLSMRIPSQFVRYRPDIQAAEALMMAANAEYGAAAAKAYPQLTLSASLGSQALTTAALFGSGTAVWSVAGQLVQPLFNPSLGDEKKAANAAFEAATAHYRQSILAGLRDVADLLSALYNNAIALAALASGAAFADEQVALTEQRYKLGAASYLEVVQAQSEATQLQLELLAARAQRLSNSAVLYQAMGGGEMLSPSGRE